jgi:TP901 family phage tail tape measure protein
VEGVFGNRSYHAFNYIKPARKREGKMSKVLGVTIAVGAAAAVSVAHTFAAVGQRVKTLQDEIKGLERQSATASNLLAANEGLNRATSQNLMEHSRHSAAALESAKKSFEKAEKQAGKYGITLTDAAKRQEQLKVKIEETNAALAIDNKLLENKTRRLELHGQIMATVATAYALSSPIRAAMAFEEAMVVVRNSTQFSNKEFELFTRKLRDIPSVYGGTYEEIATIASRGASAKIANEELEEFTITSRKMVATWKMSAEEAADALSGLRTNYRLSQGEAVTFLDSINHLASNMRKGSGGAIMEFAGRVSETAIKYGISREQTAALGATWAALDVPAKKGISATEALLHTFGKAGTASKSAQEAFNQLGIKGGGKGLEASFARDAAGTIEDVLAAIGETEGPKRMRLIADIFGEGQVESINKLVSNLGQYKNAVALAGDKTAAAGSLQNDFKTEMGTTKASLEKLKNSWNSLGVAIGEPFIGPLTSLASGLGVAVRLVTAIVDRCPILTTVVMGAAIAFTVAKVATLGYLYAATLVSDAWIFGKQAVTWLRNAISKIPLLFQATTYQMIWHRAVTLYSAAAMRVQAAWQWAVNAATAVSKSNLVASTAAMIRYVAVSAVLAAKTVLATVAQWGLNAAMYANPLGLIVIGVVAVVAAIIWLWRNCESFRTAFTAIWGGIKSAAGAVFDWFAKKIEWVVKAWRTVSGFFSKLFGGGKDNVSAVTVDTPTTTATTTSALPAAAAPARASFFNPFQRMAQSASGGGTNLSQQITFSLSFNGVPSKDVGDLLVESVKSKERELSDYFERMLANIASNQRRLAYD